MTLFRSEEHLGRWLDGRERGGTMPLRTLRALADAWYGDRLSPTWRPRSREQSQAILDGLGLAGTVWRLP